MIRPRLWTAPAGYPADHQYVRRYWIAVIGAGAVADLLRLIQAAKQRRPLRRPVHTPVLAQAGLIVGRDSRLWVRSTVPPVPPHLARRLTPALRRELVHFNDAQVDAG